MDQTSRELRSLTFKIHNGLLTAHIVLYPAQLLKSLWIEGVSSFDSWEIGQPSSRQSESAKAYRAEMDAYLQYSESSSYYCCYRKLNSVGTHGLYLISKDFHYEYGQEILAHPLAKDSSFSDLQALFQAQPIREYTEELLGSLVGPIEVKINGLKPKKEVFLYAEIISQRLESLEPE